MPKDKGLYLNLPKLLTRQTVDIGMLFYVIGYRHKSPLKLLQVHDGIKDFMEDMQFSEDEFPLDSAITRFYSLYFDLQQMDLKNKNRWISIQKSKKQ